MAKQAMIFNNFWFRHLVLTAVICSLVPHAGCMQRRSKSSSDLNTLGFMPPEPPKTAGALAELFTTEFPGYFAPQFLQTVVREFEQEATYLGAKDQIDAKSLSMMQQWLYLTMYARVRSEYLMVTMAQTLALSNHAPDVALAKFDKKFPEAIVSLHPDLVEQRKRMREALALQLRNDTQRNDARDLYRGSVEAIYFTLLTLDAREKYLKERYATSSDNYKAEKAEIDSYRSLIRNSHGIVASDAFRRNVEPYYSAEAAQANQLREAAINSFQGRFSEYMQQQRSIIGLSDFMYGSEINRLGAELARALQIESQSRFRQRIADNLQPAIAEALSYIEETATLHLQDIQQKYNRKNIIDANTRPKQDMTKFKAWLAETFKEQGLHYVISHDYPFLQAGATPLTDFVTEELNRQYTASSWRYTMIVAATVFAGLGTEATLGWIGKWPTRIAQMGIVGAQSVATIDLIRDSVGKYYQWRNARRLARLNVKGSGLMTLIQEDAAWKAMLTSFAVSGISAGVTGITAAAFFRTSTPRVTTSDKTSLGDVAKLTWEGNALSLNDWRKAIVLSWKDLGSSLRTMNMAGIGQSTAAVGFNVAAVTTQMLVSIPAALPSAVKPLLASIPEQVYRGLIMGTVMSITGMALQESSRAQGMKMFTYAFEMLGYSSTYWKSNSLNPDFKANRDAFLMLEPEIFETRIRLEDNVNTIATLERSLSDPQIDETKRAEIRKMIAFREEIIQNVLRITLSRWYKRVEFRKQSNSILQSHRFGLVVNPSFDNPQRMSIIFVAGDKKLSFTTTASAIDDLITRNVIPDPNLSKAELDALLQTTTVPAELP